MSKDCTSISPLQIKPILILLAGRTYPEISEVYGDFDDWIAQGLGGSASHVCMDARDQAILPSPSDFSGVIVSGSHSMVSDCEPWSERLAQWLRLCVEAGTPVLGICYGHQLLAHAFGGLVADRPNGIEIGTRYIELDDEAQNDRLFCGVPQSFPVQLVHLQSVLCLPPGATVIARGRDEAHQAFRIGKHAWGVQFHPEFSAKAIEAYIRRMKSLLTTQGIDSEELIVNIKPTIEASALLQRFSTLAGELSGNSAPG